MPIAECPEQALELRRLRYRLHRLGMLELEEWLGRIEPALAGGDAAAIRAALQLMDMETPMLVAMMHGEEELPEALRACLGSAAP